MKIGLVDCGLTITVGEVYNMPLGLLSIAGIAETQGHSVELLQLHRLSSSQQSVDSRMSTLADVIAERHCDMVGFTTRCDTLPIVVEVAKRYKTRRPDSPVVFGGPGATFVDKQLLDAYPFINIVVRGEGEATFAELLDALNKNKPLSEVEGISYRTEGGAIVANKSRTTLCDLDSLPPVPLHLISDTLGDPELVRTDVLVGRGCPNGCRFCSTCAFWGRKTRTRSVESVISEMKTLRDEYGFKYFTLVDDNLFGYRSLLADLCRSIQEHVPDVKYYVYVSMNFVTQELVELLAGSGCTEAFIGLETGSKRIASHIRSKFCLPEDVHNKLDILRKSKVRLTKSFIVGFPDEDTSDIDKTLMLAIETQATAPVDFMEMVQIHALSIHPGTELYDQYGDRIRFSSIKQSDFSITNLMSTESIRRHCERYPKVFTAYASHMNEADYSELVELCGCCHILTLYYPRSLFVLLAKLKMTPVSFVNYFQDYLRSHETELSGQACRETSNGHFGDIYLREFPSAVNNLCQEENVSLGTLQFTLDVESPRAQVFFNRYRNVNLCPRTVFSDGKLADMVPFVPRTTLVRSFSHDPDAVFAQFRDDGDMIGSAHTDKVDLVYFLPRRYVTLTSLTSMPCYNVIKLDPLNRYIIEHVDGVSSCLQIARKIESIMDPDKQDVCRRLVETRLRALISVGVVMLSGECS